jgi:hypothetical protein
MRSFWMILPGLALIIYLISSCTNRQINNQINKQTEKRSIQEEIVYLKSVIPQDSISSTDPSFYGDSLFPGHKSLLTLLISKYDNDTCFPIIHNKKELREKFEGYKILGDINNDKINDSVFVLPPLNWCGYNDGDSYYFTDTSLPRLNSGSECSHPTNSFKAPDIDEDGVCEVGFFYSSCASRYKSLQLYTLKNHQWKQIAESEFDVLTQDPDKVKFEDLVHKISLNKFRIRNFYDKQTYWDTMYFEIKRPPE